MDLVLKHKKITEPIINIIKRLRKETGNYYFDIIKEDLDNLTVTCPFHKNGKERKPACQIYCNYNGDILPGLTHCFACGKTVTLPQLVNYCFHNDEDDEFGTDWLISNYATVYYEYQVDIAPLNKITKNNTFISDSVLEKYKQYHPF